MAEFLKCKICGYKTVRSGMTNHIKARHIDEYLQHNHSIDKLIISLGTITCERLRQLRKMGIL